MRRATNGYKREKKNQKLKQTYFHDDWWRLTSSLKCKIGEKPNKKKKLTLNYQSFAFLKSQV